jgi:hypothetical protein
MALIEHHTSRNLGVDAYTLCWNQWQIEVIAVMRKEFGAFLPEISLDDVDWPSWQKFFVEGRSPRAAVLRAFERDL